MVTSNESDFSKMKQNWRRLAFVIAYALYTSAWLCYFRHFWFFESKNDTSSGRVALMWLFRILILLYSPFALQQMIGYFSFFPNWAAYDSEETQKPEEKFPPLVIRVVSRGDDIPVLQRGIECHTAVLERLGVTKFLYQLVVEKPNNLAQGKVEVVLVPQNYATPKKTLYKARNLQYAVSHPTPNYTTLVKEYPDVFILHLDEETLVTYEAMLNCMKFCHDGKFRFGHGMITYGWNKVTSPLATFCDNWRCACDAGVVYATCRLFHRCPLIKGGFFIMRNDLEELIGWDFGPHITGEDLHLGRLLFNMAEPADYVEGIVMEESPLSVKDLIKQRSRWLVGIMRDFYVSEEHFSCTFALISGFAVWFGFPLTTMCLCFSVLLAPLDVFYPILDDFVIFIMASMPFYFFYGSQVNFRLTSAKRLAFSIVQLTGVPMILAMAVEGCGVFHAIYTIVTEGADKAKNFHFTKKAAVMRTASHKLR